MPTTNAAPGGRDCHDPDLVSAENLAAAIATGTDLGIFELCRSLAKARQAIPAGSSPRSYAAVQAAVGIRATFDKIAATIHSFDVEHPVCPCCTLRKQLDELIEVAAKARGRGPLASSCKDLANYAGDDHPDADATRAVLEHARDVFVTAIRELYRDE
jgi:hypothetical protein